MNCLLGESASLFIDEGDGLTSEMERVRMLLSLVAHAGGYNDDGRRPQYSLMSDARRRLRRLLLVWQTSMPAMPEQDDMTSHVHPTSNSVVGAYHHPVPVGMGNKAQKHMYSLPLTCKAISSLIHHNRTTRFKPRAHTRTLST